MNTRSGGQADRAPASVVRAVGVAAVLAAAAAGCGRLEAESRETGARAVQMGTPPVQGQFVFDTTLQQPWQPAFDDYVAKLDFSQAQFPHGDDQHVRLNPRSSTTRLVLIPEARARWLRRTDFGGTMRVIARAEWSNPHANVPPIKKGRPANVAYLLTLSDTAAVWMFNDGGNIGWGEVWTFSPNLDTNPVAYTMARWWPKEHDHRDDHPDGRPRPHIWGTWVACFEGCCTSAPVQ